jgi:ribosomal protein S18 acetylase RimI-like enzyme
MDNNKRIHIRKALPEDAAAMMQLVHELALYEKAPEQVTVSLQHFKESGFGPNPVWWAWVATIEDSALMTTEIVGFALYYIRYSTWKGQRMYLEDIIVNEQWRGNGIGGKLMDALIQEAKEKRFSGMLWQVLDWNEPAIRFYKKYEAQFSDEWLNVSIEL